ncbi:hypothetical protein BST96_12230 [Oceanicoccus sagamiensis]|uniref:DUF2860 domain-containing protein n=2 Tax=Oceanicoccus sagamiensis TaxID=716816 RepID=A0A1X9NJ51_9GAMM|nr:hypothetical protein BST96_12230 [Oceanicoccus sagamiensis]
MASQVSAYDLIPRSEGWNGFINVGLGAGEVKTNMISSIGGGNVDLSDEKLDSRFDGPESKDVGLPAFAYELSYVFNDSNTQVFLGNLLEDFVRFDTTTRFGIRHNVNKVGIFGLSALSSPTVMGIKVWSDPYAEGVKRKDTDRDTSGARLSWEGVLGSNLELRASAREIEIDNENSGSTLALTPDQLALLNREGDINKFDVRYTFGSKESSAFLVQAAFVEFDLDGEAMAYDGYELSATWLLNMGNGSRLVTNVVYGDFEHDEVNPIYGATDENERLGASVTYFKSGIFGLEKHWTMNATAGFYEDDHDIDFYDSELTIISVGMLRTF